MSLRRIVLRDFVIVPSLDLDLDQGFNVLTGETGAGKSILIDALQLALGARADSGVVREGATRCEIAAEFDLPASLRPWLDEQGFAAADDSLLLRRTVDTEGRSRGWINGSAATMASDSACHASTDGKTLSVFQVCVFAISLRGGTLCILLLLKFFKSPLRGKLLR